MSVTRLKATRDAIESAGIGIYLHVMKELFAAIDAHVADEAASIALKAKVTELEAEVARLKAQQ